MPVARSDPRRTTIIGVAGLVVGTLMIAGVLIVNNLGDDSGTTRSSKTKFDAGDAKVTADHIASDGPIGYNDTATGSHPIFVQKLGDTFIAFDATTARDCVLTWHPESRDFTDCNGRSYPADGGELHHYPVSVDDDNRVIVDLSLDPASTTSS